MLSARSISMPPEAKGPVFTVSRPIRIGPSLALARLGATTLERPIPAIPVTNPRRETRMMFLPGVPPRFDRPTIFILAACDDRNQDAAGTFAVDMQCGRSCEQP